MAIRYRGIELDRPSGGGKPRLESAFRVQFAAKAAVGEGEVRLESDCPPIAGHRVRALADEAVRIAEVEVRIGVIWEYTQNLADQLHRPFGPAARVRDGTEHVQRIRVVRNLV